MSAVSKTTYVRLFAAEGAALEFSRRKNNGQWTKGHPYVVVDGPDDNYAVVDINTAIDLGMGYRF